MSEKLEKMADFFDSRVDGYEEHMFKNVDGATRYYRETALLFPEKPFVLLDLGCGTGLELDEIFKRCPAAEVTGIDLSEKMLAKLKEKHGDKRLTLIQGSYFEIDFGRNAFDAVVSVQTMHHFTPQEKLVLYKKIYAALKPSGYYVETDYTAQDVARERDFREEYRQVFLEQRLAADCYHFDIPCALTTQLRLFKKAGFVGACVVGREGNTCIFKAEKRF